MLKHRSISYPNIFTVYTVLIKIDLLNDKGKQFSRMNNKIVFFVDIFFYFPPSQTAYDKCVLVGEGLLDELLSTRNSVSHFREISWHICFFSSDFFEIAVRSCKGGDRKSICNQLSS